MLVSSSEGFWRDGLVAAILLRALMVVVFSSKRSPIVRDQKSLGCGRSLRLGHFRFKSLGTNICGHVKIYCQGCIPANSISR